ncbi:DUF4430 domain-containing protein [Oscillospiraceae bacterium OttesenSCG-928-F05]|nr:DUF4430 domain-containing protein [Oscillospiraceae bacterium OttesenSCG-928-F05]
MRRKGKIAAAFLASLWGLLLTCACGTGGDGAAPSVLPEPSVTAAPADSGSGAERGTDPGEGTAPPNTQHPAPPPPVSEGPAKTSPPPKTATPAGTPAPSPILSATAAPAPQTQALPPAPPSAAPSGEGQTPAAETEEPPEEQVVTLSLEGPEGMLVENASLAYVEGMTAFDALEALCGEQGLALDVSGSGGSVYVRGIGNIYERDYGPMSGWIYTVGGVSPSKSSGAYELSAGDHVLWRYRTEP